MNTDVCMEGSRIEWMGEVDVKWLEARLKERLNWKAKDKLGKAVEEVALLPKDLWEGGPTFNVFTYGSDEAKYYAVLEPCGVCRGWYARVYDYSSISNVCIASVHILV